MKEYTIELEWTEPDGRIIDCRSYIEADSYKGAMDEAKNIASEHPGAKIVSVKSTEKAKQR